MPDLCVQIEKVPYHKESKNGHWCILRTDAGSAKGEMRWIPREGERLKLRGDWVVYQGQREFKFSVALPDIPENPRAQLHYVCHMAHGIGDALEERIWQAYHENWKTIEPDVVPGVSDAKYKALIESMMLLDQSQDYVEALTWLLSIGCTHNMADAAWEMWDKDTIAVVNDDPYKMAMLPNYGFKDADKLRGHFGIDDRDDRRIRAAICYVILKAAEQGDTAIEWTVISEEFKALIGPQHLDRLQAVAKSMIYDTDDLHGWPKTMMIAMGPAYKNEELIWEWTK